MRGRGGGLLRRKETDSILMYFLRYVVEAISFFFLFGWFVGDVLLIYPGV